MAFSPDRSTLAIATNDLRTDSDSRVGLWNITTRQYIGVLSTTGHVSGVAFGPDGTILVTGGMDGTARLWNTASHLPVGIPAAGHTSAITNVVFSPDGATLATASDDGTTRLWNTQLYQDPIGSLCEDLGTVSRKVWSSYVPGELYPKIC